MSTAQSIIRTIVTKTDMTLPTTVNQQTDLNLLVTAMSVYHARNNQVVSWDTLQQVMEAMRDSSAVVVLYSHNLETTARVLWPVSVTLTKENHLTCRAYCTYRRQIRSFRLDRILTCHSLTTPDDMEDAA